MDSAGSVKRRYDATRRQQQARETRQAIVRAAHDLFVERGYGRTTIADIAAAAGVSSETVHVSFGGKAKLLHRVWDITVGGDDTDVLLHERPEVLRIRAESDLARRLRMQAEFSTATMQRIAPLLVALRGAAASEAAAADMLAEIDRQRLAGLSVMAAEAAGTGQLAVSEQECRDLLWAFTDGGLYHRLVVERGWTTERYVEWVAAAWIATLVRH